MSKTPRHKKTTHTCDYRIASNAMENRKTITWENKISIKFDYPLSKPVTLTFESADDMGWTEAEFLRAVRKGYRQIYREEDKAVGKKTGNIPGMFNRARSEGPHGIWGHHIDDLVLEGYTETKPGVFEIYVGS